MTQHTLEDQLREAFSSAAHEVPFTNAPSAAGIKVRGAGHRIATRMAATTAVVALGALAFSISTSGGTVGDSSPSAPNNLSLAAQVVAAVSDHSNDIFKAHTTSPDYPAADSAISADGNILHIVTHTAAGAVAQDITYTTNGATQTLKQVDHVTRTWFESSYPTPSVPDSCVQPACFSAANGGLPPGKQLGAAVVSEEGVKWWAEHGTVDSTHTQVINGKTAYSITIDESAGLPVKPGTLWIDKESNLPVRYVIAQGSLLILQSDISWVEATDANTSALTATVPDGFTQTAPDAATVPEAK